jgi:Arc/MetJ-type ribon-helix-helix transcriptional regulator
MAMMNVSLPDPMKAWVERQVERGPLWQCERLYP